MTEVFHPVFFPSIPACLQGESEKDEVVKEVKKHMNSEQEAHEKTNTTAVKKWSPIGCWYAYI